MKISIDKKPKTTTLHIVLTTATERKPITFDVTPGQLDSLLRMLALASQSEIFNFSLEL